MIGEVQISNAYDSSKIFINPDIEEAEAFRQMWLAILHLYLSNNIYQEHINCIDYSKFDFFFRDSGDSQAMTISESGDNKLETKFVSHKWMQCPEKTLGELSESTEVILYKILYS